MSELIVFPDVTAIACNYLRSELAGVSVTSRVPYAPPAEFVTVQRVGGPRRNLVVDEAILAVDCWAASDEDAHDLAQRCRAFLRAAVGNSTAGVFVYRCDEVGGPANLPDPLTQKPRFTFSATFAVRGTVEVAS